MEQVLLFPKCLDGEWRWLEIAQINQEFRVVGWQWSDTDWVDVSWNTFRDEPMG